SSPPRINEGYSNNHISFGNNLAHTENRNVNFGVNANFGGGVVTGANNNVLFSQANTLGSRPSPNIRIEDNNHYFSGAQMSKV
ncbi:MAG: hypothetical protein KDD45_09885, partial [Bdellovibrionales bacterium]|nr:hypothetical protein [Bdellovibrionales bacterium]